MHTVVHMLVRAWLCDFFQSVSVYPPAMPSVSLTLGMAATDCD